MNRLNLKATRAIGVSFLGFDRIHTHPPIVQRTPHSGHPSARRAGPVASITV